MYGDEIRSPHHYERRARWYDWTNRVAAFLRGTSRLLLRTQPVYNRLPPVDVLPPGLPDVQLSWIGGGDWYLIDFSNPIG